MSFEAFVPHLTGHFKEREDDRGVKSILKDFWAAGTPQKSITSIKNNIENTRFE